MSKMCPFPLRLFSRSFIRALAAALLVFGAGVPLLAQTHVSVPLDNQVYYLLEQAEMRGLCSPLPMVKPYSRSVILSAITEILAASGGRGGLGAKERIILEEARKNLGAGEKGLDWSRGTYRFESAEDARVKFSGEAGVGLDTVFGGGFFGGEDFTWGTDAWLKAFFRGDVGEQVSFGVEIGGGLIRAPRILAGKYNTYYDIYPVREEDGPEGSNFNREIPVYGQSRAFFPYSYQKKWDGYIFNLSDVSASGQENWPDSLVGGSYLLPELSGSLWQDALTWRFSRIRREWGGMSGGNSLVFNSAAQPFVALEGVFNPVPWFSFSALTGVLEYNMNGGLKESAWNNQNAFSIEQVEFNYKNYLHIDVGSTAVWPKRFELGYLFPLENNFLYQNYIGDFDNMGLFANGKLQYPGIGALWLSFFADEIEVSSIKRLFELDRHMFAFQAGARAVLPFLPFASVLLSYTKIEPYCYTHTRIFAPWYNQEYDGQSMPLETAYMNNGVGLGYYLPPNSDELKLRIEAMGGPYTAFHLQYQMIRHGADYGSHAVDGSSYFSELDPDGRSSNPILRKYFLQDGAYQWSHTIKAGAAYTFAGLKIPVRLFAEAGVVFSYFTDIDDDANSGSPSSWSVIDTPEYPRAVGFIMTVGLGLFL